MSAAQQGTLIRTSYQRYYAVKLFQYRLIAPLTLTTYHRNCHSLTKLGLDKDVDIRHGNNYLECNIIKTQITLRLLFIRYVTSGLNLPASLLHSMLRFDFNNPKPPKGYFLSFTMSLLSLWHEGGFHAQKESSIDALMP